MKLSAFEFANAVDRMIEQLSSEDFHLRRRQSKWLQEEVLPISRLALHFKVPGLHVQVEAFEEDGPVDGHISIAGFRAEEFYVEVTCSHDYEESLRRELLVSQRVVPGAGPIFRDKRTGNVVAEMATVPVDHDQHIKAVAHVIVELFGKKAAKSYPPNTVLLIAFDDVSVYRHHAWGILLSAIEAMGSLRGSAFRWVFLFNCANNELQQAA